MNTIDQEWMSLALTEASKAGWNAHPNPMVGAVIVKEGKLLGSGYHHGAGNPHAEVEALRDAARRGNDVTGATIYVTLEPCNHYGRTPPCTEALIAAKIARAVIGTVDTDKRVSGAGIRRLRDAGIECDVGCLSKELYALNAAFFKRTSTGLPYVTAKWAMSLDGHIATRTHHARWVTGPEARQDVHIERARHDAIMVGTQTVIDDNPQLNVRLDTPCRQPLRVILDRTRRIPLSSNVFNTTNQPTVLFTSETEPFSSAATSTDYEKLGVHVELCPIEQGQISIDYVLRTLVSRYSITTVYVEGGATLHGTLFDHHLVDAIDVYIAPKVIGGVDAPPAVGGFGIETMLQASPIDFESPVTLGQDVRLRGKLRSPSFATSLATDDITTC